MNQTGPLHALGKRNHVLCAHDVRAQTAFQGWVESNVAGRVDNDVEVVGNALGFFVAETKVGFCDISTDDYDFIAYETIHRATIARAQRVERRGSDDVIPKTGFGFFLRAGADRNVHSPDIGKAVQ